VPLVLVILVLTLSPSDAHHSDGPFACIVCGERGLADVLLNIMLFAPVGVLAGIAFGTRWSIVTAAAALSGGIEVMQVWIPGRDASIGDLLFNTVGTTLGMGLVAAAPLWIRPKSRAALRILAAAAAALAIGISAANAWLLRPSLPDSRWFGMWSPRLGHLRPWDGTVRETVVGGIDVRPGWIGDAQPLRRALLAGDTISVRARAGRPTTGLGAIFAIYDDQRREIVLIGPDREDLVLRSRLRAQDLRLDHPDLRLRGALAAFAPGDPLHIRARRGEADGCLEVNGEGMCGIAHSVANGWQLLLYPSHLPPWLSALVAAGWAAALVVPAGFFARTAGTAALGIGAALVALLGIPGLDPWLNPPSIPQLLAAALAFAAAAWIGRSFHTARNA
jgi:hypothetical protein